MDANRAAVASADLRRQTVSGLGWMGSTRVAQRFIQFALGVILARLLIPHDFGLIALIIAFTGFLSIIGDFGIASAIIQRPKIEARHLNSAFWASIGLGLVLMVLVMALAPGLAAFYGQARLVGLTVAIAPSFLFQSVGSLQASLLTREMNFKTLAVIETVALASANGAAVGMAMVDCGVWSLVALALIQPIVRSALLWVGSSWRPHAFLDRRSLAELWAFSSRLTGFNAVNYWARNADNLLIGRFVGPSQLAFYSRAYTLMLLPLDLVYMGPMRVLYPAMSRLQDDPEHVKRLYLRAIGLIAIFTFPLMVGLFVLSRPFIITMYGAQWSPVVSILQILCITGFVQSISGTTGWIYYSQGRTDRLFLWGLVSTSTAIASFFIGLPWGVHGVAVAYACWSVLITYPIFRVVGPIIDMSMREVIHAVASVGGAAILMGLVVWVIKVGILERWGTLLQLTLGVLAGAVSYALLLHLISPRSYRDLRAILSDRRRSQPRIVADEAGAR